MRFFSHFSKQGRTAVRTFCLWAWALGVLLAQNASAWVAAESPNAPAGVAQNAQGPAWVALWQDAYKGAEAAGIDPEKMSLRVCVDRTTGDAYLVGWGMGVWKSGDGGKTFAKVDGGKICGPACGPIYGYSAYVSPEGKQIAVFNMWNTQGPSGYSLDGGATWESFTNVGRDWDFGAIDWDSKTAIGARHEDDGLHVTFDAGKTWTRLERSRGNPFVTGLGAVGPEALLLATQGGIERSEDGGKTWVKVSDLGAVGPAVSFRGKLWWLCTRKSSVIVSADGGKTWAVQGEPTPLPPGLGPLFGKDENHIVLVGKDGFYETTDGGKTWKLAVALPDDCSFSGAAFDPVHDVFYIANRVVMKYERSGKPEFVPPPLPVATAQTRPQAQFVGAPQTKLKLRVLNVFEADFHDGCFYAATEDGLLTFKREMETGKLSLLALPDEFKCGGYSIRCAAGRLYAVTWHEGYRRMNWHGLAWYDFDGQTGQPARKGLVDFPAARQMVLGPDQKDLYLKGAWKNEGKVYWCRLGTDGKPALAGEVSGKGLGASANGGYPGMMRLSPDGRHLYTVSAKDCAIGCVERKPTGEIAYKGSTDLTPVAKPNPENYHYQWVSVNLSPDGKWLYATVRNGKPTENFYGIFKRDPDSGSLTFQETVSGLKDPLANVRAWTLAFAPDGSGGYLGSAIGPLITFQYDAKTGHLTNPAQIKETRNFGSLYLVQDADNGFLYIGGGDYGIVSHGLLVLKVDKKAAK